jgi:predicted MFS family arabinose efflux permease
VKEAGADPTGGRHAMFKMQLPTHITYRLSMTQRQLKFSYFFLTALNTLATSYYFTYLFFFLRDRFGFGDRDNLWISALHGLIYIFSAWQCGKFAQRRGFFVSLKVGFGGLVLIMVAGALLDSVAGIVCALIGYSVVLLFTWPVLEALVSENETRAGVQHNVGIYNCVWAGVAALAYFTGGALYEGLGRRAVFHLPAAIFLVQFILTILLSRPAQSSAAPKLAPVSPPPHQPEAGAARRKLTPQTFMKMAWLANPFAYMAINTLWAVIPGLAIKFNLSPAEVGSFCSVWLFGRFVAFAFLWRWTGWHYRFRWLVAAFGILIAGFLTMLLASQLWIVVLAQVFFGLAAGFIYYSSLFYSMDVGEGSAEHGGLHEAAIGMGIFAGPAVGAATLVLIPQQANAAALAVSGLLLLGLGGLFGLWGNARLMRSRARD